MPTSNHFSVNNLDFRQFLGMEEVTGSIPIRPTNHIQQFASRASLKSVNIDLPTSGSLG